MEGETIDMDIKESKAGSKKTTPPSEWFKNVAKSIGYSSSEVIREITPNTHSFIADNYSYGKELAENFRDAKENSKSVAEMLNLGSQMNTLNTAVKNAIDDIKTGKIYNKERAEAFDDDDEFGAFLNGDFDIGGGESSSDTSSKPTVINNVKVTRDDNKLVSAVTSATEANLQGTKALLKQNKDMATATIAVNHQLAMQMTKGLETINTNISQLVNFQNDSMAKYIGASIQYYDESLKVMKESLDKLVAMAPAPTRDRKQRFDGYDAVFGGGSFSLEGYVQNIKRNLEKAKDENMLIQGISSFLEQEDTLERLAKSPLTFVADFATKKIIPMAVRETVDMFDKSMTAFFPAMIDKFSRMAKNGNMITETIGQLFGIDTTVKSSVNMANYTRGAIPFDGETKRAITDVIPTYLRKIHSALSGGKEVAFNYETGKWDTVENMQKAYDAARLATTRAGYSDQIGDLNTMLNSVKFESQKQQDDFRKGMDKFLYELSRTTEQISFDTASPTRMQKNQEKARELYSFGDPKMDKLLYSMMASLTRTQQMDLVGSGRYKNLSAMQNFFTDLEESPTKFNTQTILGGLKFDEHVTLDEDGNIKKAKASGLNRLDRYGHDDLYYLREIAGTLMQGIRVYTSGNADTSSPDFLNSRLDRFNGQVATRQDVKSTKIINYNSDKEAEQNNIVMGDLDITDDMIDKLRNRVEHQKKMEKDQRSDKFGDTMRDLGFGGNSDSNLSKIKNLANEAITKPTKLLEKVFEKIDMTMYNIVFGIREDGKGSFMDRTLDKMSEMFEKVGNFATEKIFLPVSEFLLTTFDKMKSAAGENPIVEGIKNGVKYWFVGEKDENGKRQGGVFSEIMNSVSDTAKSVNHAITGIPYKDSQGREYGKKEDSLFGSIYQIGKEIFGETKKHFFGDKNSDDPDKRSGMLLGVANVIGDGMADWSEILFGTKRDKDKLGSEILKENTEKFVKATPKGFLGALGGMGIGTALAAGTGIIGSFLLPGAPIALALAGGALGMATGFDSFNDWAFGEIGANGKRIGGALVSANTKQFLKENKSKLIGGAVGGALLSMVVPAIADSIIPGSGVIMDFLSPFGVVGAAFQGMATAMVMKSDAVMSWLFGAKNINGERVGGALTRLFGKKSDEIAKKNVKSKLGMAAVGAVGGAIAGKMAGIGIGSALSGFGFLGALAATPFGPVGGALLGLGAAITLGSEKFRTFLFGKNDGESEYDDIGFLGRTMNMFNYEIIMPFKDAVKDTIGGMSNWFRNRFMADVAFVTEPFVKTIKDTVSGTFKAVRGIVWSLPKFLVGGTVNIISGAVEKMKNALKDSVVEKAILSPVKNFSVQVAGAIMSPLRKFGSVVTNAAGAIFKASHALQAGLLSIPALLKMGFDRTFETTKSMFKNIGSLFFNKENEGFSFGERAKRWWTNSRAEGKENSSYADTLFSNRRASIAKYKEEKEARAEARKQRKNEYNAIRAAVRGTGYNQDAINVMSEEDKAMVNVFKTLQGKKMVTNQETLTKIQTDLFKATGLTVSDLFVLGPKEKLEGLNKNQIKFIKTVIDTSKKHGIRGDALKKKMDIGQYQMTQMDVTDSILDETKRMRELMEGLTSSLEKVIDSGTLKVNVDHMADNVIDEMTRPINAPNYDQLINNYRQTGQPAQSNPFNTVNVINSPFRRYQANTDQSSGGAIGGAVMNATRSITSRVTGAIGGMTKEVSKLGCGAIVLSKVLMDAGIRMSANEIYSFAQERGLVQPGVGMSSDVFKAIASAKGLTYSFAKANRQGLERLFNVSNMVIARLSTGVGHFVVLHSYSKQENNVAIDDPMGKIGGVYSIDQILSMATHLYAVYRKGASSNPLKSIMQRASSRATGQSSVGGAVGNVQTVSAQPSSNKTTSIMNKLDVTSGLSAYIREMGVIPVMAIRSKEEAANEQKMMKSIAGGSGGEGAVQAHGVNRPDTKGSVVSAFNMLRLGQLAMAGMGMLWNGGKNAVQGVRNMRQNGTFDRMKVSALEAAADPSGTARNIGNRAAGASQQAYGRAKVKAAEIQASPWSSIGAMIGATGRTAARPASMMGTAGRRITRAILTGRSAALGAKVSQELVQMGDTASRGNMSSLSGNYSTSATGGLDDSGRLDINAFLKRQGEKMAAQAEANFRGATVDLQTRIEINTRYTAQLAAEILDSMNRFQDWLKDFLGNSPFSSGGGGGGDSNSDGDSLLDDVKVNNFFGGAGLGRGGDDDCVKLCDPIEIDIDLPKLPTPKPDPDEDDDDGVEIDIDRKRKPVLLPVPSDPTRTPSKTTTRRPVTTPIGLPMPKVYGLPEPQKTRKVKDVMTGEYRDLEIRGDVIDVDYRDITNQKSLPIPDDPTINKKGTKALPEPAKQTKSLSGPSKPLALPMPQTAMPEPEPILVGRNKKEEQLRRAQASQPTGSSQPSYRSSRGPVIEADWTDAEIIDMDAVERAQGKPSSNAAKPAGGYAEVNPLEKYLNQSKEEFAQNHRNTLEQMGRSHEEKLSRKLQSGEISQEQYEKDLNRHRKEMAKQYAKLDKTIDEGYSKLQEARGGSKPKSKAKSFFKDAADIFTGKNQKVGIAAGADAIDDIGKMGKNAIGKAGKAIVESGIGKFGKSLFKGVGKTASKFLGGAATGGALTAGMTALDAKYGYDNAASIMKMDPSKITKGHKAAAATAASVVGFVPLIDMADEMLGGHAKEWIAKLITGLGPIWEKMKDKFSEAWESVKETVTEFGTKIKDAAVEKWEGIKEGVGGAWDFVKEKITGFGTTIKEKVTSSWETITGKISEGWQNVITKVKEAGGNIVKAATEKWENIKTTISTKWEEAKTTVTNKLKDMIKAAQDKWEAIKTSISSKWDETKTTITGKLTGLVQAAGTKWEEIKQAIPKKFTEVKNTILEKLGGIKVSFSDLAGNIASKVKEKILAGIGSLKVTIFGKGDSVGITANKVVEKAKEVASSAVDKAKDTGKKVVSKAKNTTSKAWKTVKNIAGKLFGQGGPLPGELVPNAEEFAKGCTTCKKKRKKKAVYGQGVVSEEKFPTVEKDNYGGGEINGAYFSQKDSRWSGTQLAKGSSMGEAGCGPTAIANVVTDLTGEKVLPTEAAKFAQANGYIDPEKGTNSNLFGDFAISKGVKVNQTTPDMSNIRSQLAMGNKVILRGEQGKNYTDAGHYIIADGIDSKGNISVKDPLGKGRSGSFSEADLKKGLTNAFVASTTGKGLSPNTARVFAMGNKVGFANPMPAGKKTSGYGWRDIGSGREFHKGLDLSTGGGKRSQVQASADGVVLSAKWHKSYGNYIVIKHDVGREMTTVYAHLSEMKVGPGAKVKQGQVIGIEGTTGRSTGNHLHFEVHEGPYDYDKNTRDPEHYIGKNGVPTPAPFEGDTGDMSGIAGATAGWSLSNITSAFDVKSFMPSVLTNLPSAMEAMSNAVLFGAPVAGVAAALTGTSASAASNGVIPDLTGNANAEKVWNYFKSQGYSPHAIAGIMGNLQQESGMDPTKKQTGGTAKGIAQWEGGRWANLVSKANAAGVSEWDLAIQLKHITDELGGEDPTTASILNKKYGGLDRLKNVTDSKQAVEIFEKSFERAGKPMYEKRYAYADAYFNQFNSTTGNGIGGPMSGEDMDKLMYNSLGRDNNALTLPEVTGAGDLAKKEIEPVQAEKNAIHANGFGSIENIEAENTKYESTRQPTSSSSPSITQVFGEGTGGSWSTENVERVITLLQSIADSTSETKSGISTMNNNFNTTNVVTNNDNSSNTAIAQKQPAAQTTRKLNDNNVRRSADIIRGRK